MPPTRSNGKICYIEIPATDIARSSDFYQRVFGWSVRKRDNGSIAFDDAVGEVSGSWVLGRPPASSPGFVVYVMVDSVAATLETLVANGGQIAQPIGADAPENHRQISRSGRKRCRTLPGAKFLTLALAGPKTPGTKMRAGLAAAE